MKQKTIHRPSFVPGVFALLMLFLPDIGLIDPLPDFLGYAILVAMFSRAADTAPYFDEAVTAFRRLFLLTLGKIPGELLILFVRRQNTADQDIRALVALVFAVAEAVLLCCAVRAFFDAMTYFGERSEALALIRPFPLDRRGKHLCSPENLRNFCYFFSVFKCALYALPEMLLLTRTNEYNAAPTYTAAHFYPFALVASLLLGTVVGIVFLHRMLSWMRAIRAEGRFADELDRMLTGEMLASFEKKQKIRTFSSALGLIAISSLFYFELAFDNFRGVNLLPHFLFGLLLFLGCLRLSGFVRRAKRTAALAVAFSAVAAVGYVLFIRFVDHYRFANLSTDADTVRAYLGVEILAVLEFLLLCAVMVSLARTLSLFAKEHTGLSPDDPGYRKIDREFHRSMTVRCWLTAACGMLSGAAKCFAVFQNSEVGTLYVVDTEGNILNFETVGIPWFSLVLFGTALLFLCLSLSTTGALRDEAKTKLE